MKLNDLTRAITLKYGRKVTVQYEDDDGDRITIDSEELVRKALSRIYDGKVRLFLLPQGPTGTAVGGSSGGSKWVQGGNGKTFEVPATQTAVMMQRGQKNEIINELSQQTAFNKHHLNLLYKQYQKTAVNGMLDKERFAKGLQSIGINDKTMIDHLFTAFDSDKDGFVDFRDFACGLSILHQGSYDDRLQLAFNAYDLDGNGTIDKEEMLKLLQATFTSKGLSMGHNELKDMVDKSFDKADVDGNGVLDFDEFKRAVLQNEILVATFWKEPNL